MISRREAPPALPSLHRAAALAADLLAAPPTAFLLVGAFVGAVNLAPAVARAFDGGRAAATVHVIAADDFQGRDSGLPGGRKIEEYVAARFHEWGLTPAGQNGTFFKEFPLLVTKERAASVTLLDSPFGKVDFLYGDDFEVVTNSGTGDITAEAILVGHGLSDKNRQWDDYANVDVNGKIAIVLRGTPENGYDWGMGGARDSTLHEAVRRGAAGVIFVGEGLSVQGAAVHEGSYFPNLPIVFGGDRILQHLLMNSGYDLKRYKDELKEKPVPLATGKRLRLRTSVVRIDDGRARDVVGMLEGSDPQLSNEIIVMGGHMDHVGMNGNGIVYNGANDNGSGCATVMELARSFAQGGAHPKRTFVFMTFAGEEQGLLGSEAFAKEPTFDLARVVAMINMDMVGHGNGKVGLGGGEDYPEIRKAFTAALDSVHADSLVVGRAWRGESSDHAPFWKAGIPTMNIWSEGDHRFYHTLQDDPQWIKTEVLGSVGRTAEAWIRTLGDWPAALLVPHRAGRAMLYAADQIDFDGAVQDAAPSWVRAGVRWFDGAAFAGDAYVGALAELRGRVEKKEIALARTLKDVREQTKDGRRGVLIGLRADGAGSGGGRGATATGGAAARNVVAGVPKERLPLLANLEVGMVRSDAGGAPDSAALVPFAKAGVTLLAPSDPERLASLPKDAKRCVRFFPGRGEHVAVLDSLPRKQMLYVVGYEGGLSAAELSSVIVATGWDRVHLDLVPWLAKADEPAIAAFLEELQAAGKWTPAQMAGLLGGNLARL